jgi:hypothetical protein
MAVWVYDLSDLYTVILELLTNVLRGSSKTLVNFYLQYINYIAYKPRSYILVPFFITHIKMYNYQKNW